MKKIGILLAVALAALCAGACAFAGVSDPGLSVSLAAMDPASASLVAFGAVGSLNIEKLAAAATDAEARVTAFITGAAPALWSTLSDGQKQDKITTAESEVTSTVDLDAWLITKRAEVGPSDTTTLAHAAFQSVCRADLG